MRRVGKIFDAKKGVAFGRWLTQNGIKNQVEVIKQEESASPQYECLIWVYDEEDLEKAAFLLDQFQGEYVEEISSSHRKPLPPVFEKAPVTLSVVFLCCTLFILSFFTTPVLSKGLSHTAFVIPATSSPVEKAMVFDWPQAFTYIEEVIDKYGVDALNNPSALPPEGRHLLETSLETPYWTGFYPILVDHLQGGDYENQAPLFQNIRQGQIWRSFTPALLHYDLFHLLFNMMWVVYLGRMIERRIGGIKMLLFILCTGVFANVSQYLMSGSNFLGYSGIVCAYLGFLWTRQKKAPWEGYPLPQSVINFMSVFIFSMAIFSFFSFYGEIFFNTPFATGIANTAHLAGGFAGVLLGNCRLFSTKIV